MPCVRKEVNMKFVDFEILSIENVSEEKELTYEPDYIFEEDELEQHFDELEQHFATLCVAEVLESL